jgi:hypothetical protein
MSGTLMAKSVIINQERTYERCSGTAREYCTQHIIWQT